MKLSELSRKSVSRLLGNGGLRLAIGPFNVCLSSSIAAVAEHLSFYYRGFDLVDESEFIDFNVALAPPSLVRRYFRANVDFSFDGYIPFKPLPYAQASAFFEWGLNWCIASHSNQYLIIHSAVVEKNGQAFMFAGTPGSGKSTLCAALVCSGWRLLSDEMALLSLDDGLVYPVPRPISLKNQSIDIIRNFSADTIIGPVVDDTQKGTVSHMRPPEESVRLSAIPAQVTQIIFPKYQPASVTELLPLTKGRTLLKVAENCFNYHTLSEQGFHSAAQLCDSSGCYEFRYSNLDEAIALFAGMGR